MYIGVGFNCLVFEFLVPLENFSLIWRGHRCRWRAVNFDRCSALLAIEQWGFFSVAHILWHGASGFYGHLRGHVTFTPNANRLAMELLLPDLGMSQLGFKHPTIRLRGKCSNPLRHRGGFNILWCLINILLPMFNKFSCKFYNFVMYIRKSCDV